MRKKVPKIQKRIKTIVVGDKKRPALTGDAMFDAIVDAAAEPPETEGGDNAR